MRGGKGMRRAGVEAGAARAAAIRLERQVGLERRVAEHDADEGERADARIDQHRVLADPAEPRACGQLALGYGTRVPVAPRPSAGNATADPFCPLFSPA